MLSSVYVFIKKQRKFVWNMCLYVTCVWMEIFYIICFRLRTNIFLSLYFKVKSLIYYHCMFSNGHLFNKKFTCKYGCTCVVNNVYVHIYLTYLFKFCINFTYTFDKLYQEMHIFKLVLRNSWNF